MARFELQLPDMIMKDFRSVHDNAEKIFGEMTRAGAEVVKGGIEANAPSGVRDSAMMGCLAITRQYKTPSDDGINTKVAFYGYFTNEEGKKVPAPVVARVFEFGRSDSRFPKQPFVRKSFNRKRIEQAMIEAQEKASEGILEK